MKYKLLHIIRCFAFLTLLLGAIGIITAFVCKGLSYIDMRMVSSVIQFPLGDIEDIAIDNQGKIICFCSDHYRLQVYNGNGNFYRGWFVNSSLRTARIYVDTDNCIHVATYYDKHYVFDVDGDMISESKQGGVYKEFADQSKNRINQDNRGNIYDYSIKGLRSKIYQITPSGEKKTIISTPYYLWWLGVLFPSYFLVVFSIIILYVIRHWLRKVSPGNLEQSHVSGSNLKYPVCFVEKLFDK